MNVENLPKKLLSIVITAILTTTPMVASSAEQEAIDEDKSDVEKILVYARKREETLQSVPISMSVTSEKGIKSIGAQKLADLSDTIANVQIDDNFEPTISIRGISTNARTVGLESGVGVYIDGVFVSRSGLNADLAAIAAVEVLRGPQGSLFGKNTIAGAVNIITKRPGPDFAGSAAVNVGNYGQQNFRGYIEGALHETVDARLSLSSLDSDGHYTNVVTGSKGAGDNSTEVRADIDFYPSDDLTVRLSFDHRKIDINEVTSHLVEGVTPESIAIQNGFLGYLGFNPDDVLLSGYDIAQDTDYAVKVENWGAAATIEYNLPEDYTFTSITARRSTWKDQASHDDDGLPVFLLNSGQQDRQLFTSQEFRITSPGGEDLDWLVGVYYDAQDLNSYRPIDVSAMLSSLVTGAFEQLSAAAAPRVKSESYALYANVDYDFMDDFTLTIGGRFTKEEKTADFALSGSCISSGLCYFPQLDLDLSYEDSSFDPSISLSYNIAENITTYFKYTTGFKSGGFNVDFIQPTELREPGSNLFPATVITEASSQTPFDKEEVKSAEVGLKMTIDRRITANLAVFNMDYNGFQVTRFNGSSYFIDNAGEATLQGAELDLVAQLTEELRLIGGIGYVDSEFDVYDIAGEDGSLESLKGNQFSYSPNLTSNIAAEYTKSLGGNGSLFVRMAYTYKDEMFTSPENTAESTVGSQEYYNARIGWTSEDGALSVALWGNNLKDSEYVIRRQIETTLPGLVTGIRTMPRTYGIELSYDF